MKKGLSRRNLFKFMAIGGATTVAASCEQKPEKLIPLLVPPEGGVEYTPHASLHYMTSCRECDAGCGLMVTVREGRAQKAEGNPNHPMNQGALCGQGQASMQALYNPTRYKTPLKDGQQVSWSDALKTLENKIKSANGKVVYLTHPAIGSERKFIQNWLDSVGGGKIVDYSFRPNASMKKAAELAFGKACLPIYQMDQAKYLLNFSSDFLGGDGGQVENSRQFADMHAYKDGHKNKFVHVGPHVSLTGANADFWIPIKVGTEGLVALAMAYEIRRAKRNYPQLAQYLEKYRPDRIANQAGTTVEKIQDLAKDFMNESPSLAIAGGNVIASEKATETLVAVNILNAVAGNIGQTVNFLPTSSMSAHQEIFDLMKDLEAGKVEVLIVDDVNPVYHLPPSTKFSEALAKTYLVSLSSTKDETNSKANLIFSTLTPYESWGDAFPRDGIYNLQQPVMAPVNVFDAVAKEDILLAVGKNINIDAFAKWERYMDYIRDEWQRIHQSLGSYDSFENFWVQSLQDGGVFQAPTQTFVDLQDSVTSISVEVPKLEGDGLALIPSSTVMMGDGSGANKPWLQEIPDPMSQIVWDSWVEINPDTAKKMGIADRSVIEVSTPQGSVTATVIYYFGVHRDAIVIPVGQGHTDSGEVADRFGVNVLELLPSKLDAQSGEMALISTTATLKSTATKSYTVNMDGNARQLGREIASATTISELLHPHHKAHHRPKSMTEFYPPREETAGYYEPYRWGMTIDLDRCTGCASCVVACYAENNIPVVGKERAALGREMSWLQLQRYIEGYGDDFQVRFTLLGCQHCSNAGCEPVCPVYATYHNHEGLNAQIYNRCVGTRYCANNCAYKVRRFNWFNYDFPEPLNQQLNSTMTTRRVGVMEKCTFCIQRITEAKFHAQEKNRDVQDGEVVVACQQSCATGAITFGNLKDPNSKVSKLAMRDDEKKRDRQHEVLAELNFKPAVTYLKKVLLRSPKSLHGEKAHSSHEKSNQH